MKSVIIKRSVIVSGHKTSISLEDPFWKSLKEIAGLKHLTLSALLAAIDSERHEGNLSSAIRLFILRHYREQLKPKERFDAALELVNSSTQLESRDQHRDLSQPVAEPQKRLLAQKAVHRLRA